MGAFLKSASGKPIEPTLDVYELDSREPCLRIDQQGQVYLHQHPKQQLDKAEIGLPIRPSLSLPLILFADIPVMIHTSFGFTLAPMRYANDNTGPEKHQWLVTYGDETRHADTYDQMREIASEIGRHVWAAAGEPLDPRWPRAAAEEHLWRQVSEGVREILLPDDTVIRVEERGS